MNKEISFNEERLKRTLIKLEEYFNVVFVEPKAPELKMKYIQLLLGSGNLCLGIQEHWCYADNETISLFYDFLDVLNDLYKKNDSKSLKRYLRLGLFLYCHLYESKLIPRILYNLLTIQKDGSYNERPFPKRNDFQERSINYKMNDIYKLNEELGYKEYNAFLAEVFYDDIRNSFFHSDYNFNDNGLVINCNRNANLKIINYNEYTYYLNLMINYFNIFLSIHNRAMQSFPKDYSFLLHGQTVRLTRDASGRVNGLTMGYES